MKVSQSLLKSWSNLPQLDRNKMGVEAPRNSMEFLPETSSSYGRVYDNVPFSCQVKNPSKLNMSSTGLPMKKLIDEEMSRKANSNRSTPSVIARLMGMDSLPSEAKSATNQKGKSSEVSRGDMARNPYDIPKKPPHSDVYSGQHELPPTRSTQGFRPAKHRSREHPQEDILQNFKKEFKAWQANKMWEHTKTTGLNSSPESGREKIKSAQGNCKKERSLDSPDSNQRLGHEKTSIPAPSKEKIVHSSDAMRSLACEKISESTKPTSGELLNLRTNRSSSRHESSMSKLSQFSSSETMSSGTRSTESGYSPNMQLRERNGKSPSPTTIVVLKPGYENGNDIDETWLGSSASIHKQVPMDDFLEEVRERLRMEIQGKPRSTGTRGITSNMCANEKIIPGPRQIAQNVSRQIRESKDVGATLIRSESSRLYKSETQSSESVFHEFTNRDARKLLTERLRNTLRNEEHAVDSNVSSRRARASASVKKSTSLRPFMETMEVENKMVYLVDDNNSTEGKTRPSREEEENNATSFREVPPSSLIRSLSAPSSGTAFGKLVLEDQNLLSGAHTRRKHEMRDKLTRKARKNKDSFDFKGRVSNLKHNLNLKGKLFGKKMHLSKEASVDESDRAKVVETAAPSLTNLSIPQTRLENPTEVPPSPVSVTSWSHDDLSKPGHPSPVSPLDVPFTEEYPSSRISEEILPQISEECSCDVPGEPTITSTYANEESQELKTDPDLYEDEIADVDGHEEAYVRDILITSGLYERWSGSHAFLSLESLSQPLARWVFDEVEEALGNNYRKVDGDDVDASLMSCDEACSDRKMLFDLVNEALPNVLKPFINSLGLKRNPYTTAIPHGKELFEDVLKQIQILTHMPEEEQDCSLESIATYDMKKAPWPVMVLEEISGVGAEVEKLIIDQLVEEFILELYYD